MIGIASICSSILSLYYAGNQIDFGWQEFVDGERQLYAIIEFIFLVDILRSFITEYISEGGKTLFE